MSDMIISVSKKRAIVMGATGLIGNKLMEELILHKAYDEILTIGRRPSEYESDKITHLPIDFGDITTDKINLSGDDLFIAFGTTRAVAGSKERFREIDFEYPLKVMQSAYANGVKQVILVSSLGADENSLFFYLQVKGELESALRQMPFWGIHIFQPSLLLGERQESRIGEAIAQRLGRGLNFFTPGIVYKYKPIEATDVAKAMVNAAQAMNEGVHLYSSQEIHRMTATFK